MNSWRGDLEHLKKSNFRNHFAFYDFQFCYDTAIVFMAINCDINLSQSTALKITFIYFIVNMCINVDTGVYSTMTGQWSFDRITFNRRFIQEIMTQDYLNLNISKYCWLQKINVLLVYCFCPMLSFKMHDKGETTLVA